MQTNEELKQNIVEDANVDILDDSLDLKEVSKQDDMENIIHNFVRRLAMILQAEKAIIMLYSPETSQLIAQVPAIGFGDVDIKTLSYNSDIGLAGKVFNSGEPKIVIDVTTDPEINQDFIQKVQVRNALVAPLIIERHQTAGSVVKKTIIGVVLVFNKKFNKSFTKEDENLLTVLARNSSALIGNAKEYSLLKGKAKRLESTFDSMQTGIISFKTDTREMISINDAAAKVIGVSKSKLMHSKVGDIKFSDEITAVFDKAFEEDECFLEPKIGDKYYRVDIGTNGDRANEKIIILTDITDLKNVEQMKTNFVSTVSHELRTPLTVIKGFISTLLTDPEGEFYDTTSRMEFYNIIDTECDRLVRLISDLLSISRIERGLSLQLHYTKFDVMELIEKCVLFHKNYTDKHDLIFDKSFDSFEIEADKDKLDQVITNLISNAIKYSPEGGDIIVSCDVVGENVEIVVKDHGFGISKEHLDKIFECFHRVDNSDSRKIGGTGIGLFLVDSLVKEHNGRISVESELGEGSAFTVTLPIRRDA